MKIIASGVIAILALGFASCASETQTSTTTTTREWTSTTDTSALDPSRNTNMQPSTYSPMGSTPR